MQRIIIHILENNFIYEKKLHLEYATAIKEISS